MLEKARLSVQSHLEELVAVQQWFRVLISRLAIDNPWINDQFDQLNLALAEGFTNAVRHAHADLPGSTPIEIELMMQPEQIEICIFDQGEPFDPSSLSEPKPGALREGGYGWFLLRRLADKVTYDRMPSNMDEKPLAFEKQTETSPDDQLSGPPAKVSSGQQADKPPFVPRNCLRIVKTARIV